MSIVNSISFKLATDADIENRSSARISVDEINNNDGIPVSGGICDINLGTTNRNLRCGTCDLPRKKCMGHRGHIKLVTEYFTPNAILEIVQWLKIICHGCGALMVDENKLTGCGNLLSLASSLINDEKPCTNCSELHSKIKRDAEDSFTIWAEGNRRKKLYPKLVKDIFSRISARTLKIMRRVPGTEPVNFICRTVPVLPNTVRYPVMNFMGGGNTHHPFTNAYYHIVKRQNQLQNINDDTFKHLNKDGIIQEDLDSSLQMMFQTIYDMMLGSSATNTKKRQLNTGNKPFQSILRNLPSKKGLLRNNLLGKRVVYMARSTISGNCELRLDEVGLPLAIAQTLQVEEIVQEFNYEILMTYFLNGKNYPGCSNIIRKRTGEFCDVANMREKYLEIGDTVCRDVVDGDVCIFNRQPTLKPSSMGVHKIKVLTDSKIHTLQMNVLICKNYNADFDGDQMTIIVNRTIASRAEAAIVAAVHTHFISDGDCKPLNGEDLDSIIGLYDITRNFTRIDKFHTMALIGYGDDKIYTGRDIISELLKDMPINYKKRPHSNQEIYKILDNDPSEHMVVIKNGVMTEGVLDGATIGRKNGSVFHIISQEYGKKRAFEAIYNFQQVALKFITMNGFTMSTSDIVVSKEERKNIDIVVRNVLTDSQCITDNLNAGLIIPPIGKTIEEYYEAQQKNALRPPDAELMTYILRGMNTNTNGFLKMIATDAKGNNSNFTNICAVVGQQTIDEERIQRNYCYDRIMAYCPRSSLDAEYFGYCPNSYITGSNLIQFLSQAKAMRFALIAKAMLTAITGTFLRKGVMNNQNSVVDNNRRISKDFKIVQYIYGEDGLNPKYLEEVFISTISMNDAELKAYAEEHYELLKKDRDEYREIHLKFEQTVTNIAFSNKVLSPINVKRYIESIALETVDSIEKTKNINTMLKFCEDLPKIHFNRAYTGKTGKIYQTAVWVYCVLIRSELTPKVLGMMTEQQLKFVLEKIYVTFAKSLVDYGSPVGITASQFICEPLTQGMLNSGHKSATGGSNRSGIIRFDEIFKLKNIAEELSSSMHVPLDVDTEEEAHKIASSIEYIVFKTFARDCKIIIESYRNIRYTETVSDKIWVAEGGSPPGDLTNICIRFAIDKSMLVLKNVSMELIIEKLNRIAGVFVVTTPESVHNIVVRVWLRSNIRKGTGLLDEDYIKLVKNNILETAIRGSDRIIRTEVIKKKRSYVDADGSIKVKDQFIIVTSGSNLYSLSMQPGINKQQFSSNSIIDTYKTLGIVAARNKIITETALFLGDKVNYRHFQIYADEMTRTGTITSLERNGLALREPNNILLRMAYGSPIEVLQRAAINGIKSKIVGPAAQQMLGLTPNIGTNYNKLIMNEDFIKQNTKSINDIINSL